MSNDATQADTATFPAPQDSISRTGRWLALMAAFFGWYFAGMLLSTQQLAMRPAAINLLSRTGVIERIPFDALSQRAADKTRQQPLSPAEQTQLKSWQGSTQRWFAFFQTAFLCGAAAGGLIFGRVGDRFGRSKALGAAVVCYAAFSGVTYFVTTPEQLLVSWFLAALGVGGTWPNGVALVAEIWSGLSRPMISGIIGMAANVGLFMMSTIATFVAVTPDSWRWMMAAGFATVILGALILLSVPESPRWLASRQSRGDSGKPAPSVAEVFRSPHLGITCVGILLATVPILGGSGAANWMIPWADQVATSNPLLKAEIGQARALAGCIGSLLGGWIATLIGRRCSYFLTSLGALICAEYIYCALQPTDPSFLWWVAGLGFFSGIYFGWLPLVLPELFPTSVRSTGAGVCFNFGRVTTAGIVFLAGSLTSYFAGDYARIGQIMSGIFAIGLLAILFTPDSSRRQLAE